MFTLFNANVAENCGYSKQWFLDKSDPELPEETAHAHSKPVPTFVSQNKVSTLYSGTRPNSGVGT